MDQVLFRGDALRAYAPRGVVVLVAFVRAVPIMLRRLREANAGAGPGCMRRICILALPLPDLLPRAGGRDDIARAVEAGTPVGTREQRAHGVGRGGGDGKGGGAERACCACRAVCALPSFHHQANVPGGTLHRGLGCTARVRGVCVGSACSA
jgi:hypothetical protein